MTLLTQYLSTKQVIFNTKKKNQPQRTNKYNEYSVFKIEHQTQQTGTENRIYGETANYTTCWELEIY